MNVSVARGKIGRCGLLALTAGRAALTAAMLLALAPCVTASAASPVQKTAYKILLHTFKGELATTKSELEHGVAAAEHQLAPCRSAVQGPSLPQGAAHALKVELEVQAADMALHPFLKLWIAQDSRTEQLPIGPKLRAALQIEVSQSTAALQVSTCADVSAWQAAGFAPSFEPSGTRLMTAYANTPPVHTERALYHMLSARRRRTIKPIKRAADVHTNALGTVVDTDLAAWLPSP